MFLKTKLFFNQGTCVSGLRIVASIDVMQIHRLNMWDIFFFCAWKKIIDITNTNYKDNWLPNFVLNKWLQCELKIRSKYTYTSNENNHTWKYPYMKIPIHENTHTWKYPYMKIPIRENTHTWKYPYMKIPIRENTHTWKYPYMKITIHENTHTRK